MRRSALYVLLAALVSLTLMSPTGGASAGPFAMEPGSTKVTGAFSVEPGTFVVGQKVKIGANFPNGHYVVTLFREADDGSWDAVATDETNDYGNAWFHDYEVDGEQTLYARITDGPAGRTTTRTLTPTAPVEPTDEISGSLNPDPAVFTAGQKVKIQANFPNGRFDVGLYRKSDSGDWLLVATDRSRASGNAYFKNYEVQGGEELFARRKDNGEHTEVDVMTPTEIVPENFPVDGSLSLHGKVHDGREGVVKANFPNGVFEVTLYRDKKGTWVPEGSATSNKTGNAYIKGVEFDGKDDYFALTSDGRRTHEEELVPSPPSDVTGGPKTLGHHVIYVTTNNGGTPKTRGVDYEGKAVLASGDELSKTFDLETIAVRGNSTSTRAKKPYKLKFDDNEKPFGMKKEKTFVLLANYLDWTLVRGEVAWSLSRLMPSGMWTPDSRYAELFLNGRYMGSYQMVESIKIDKNRMELNEETGQIIEFDPHFKEDGVPGMTGKTGVKYSWKDPDEYKTLDDDECDTTANPDCVDPEGLTGDKVAQMKKKIRQFEDVLYGPDGKRNWASYEPPSPADDWKTYLDLDSAVDYYLVREYTKDQDADMFRSNFFHTNDVDPESDAKFFMGPLWDFDRSAGATPDDYFTGISKPTGWWMRGDGSVEHNTNKIHWYTRIAKDPVFLQALEDRWAQTREVFEDAGRSGSAPGGAVSRAVAKISGNDDYALGRTVAENDRARWKGHGKRYDPKTSNYGKEVEWLRAWYDKRFAWMDGRLG